MRYLKIFALVLVLAVAGLFGGALLLPPGFAVQRSVDIAAPVDKVYALVASPREWARWTVWNQRDPGMKMSYTGPDSGAGAGWSWLSDSEGSGAMQFTAAEPGQRIAYTLSFPDFDAPSTGELGFEATAGGTRVRWSMQGSMGSFLVFRWMGLFADRLIGPDFEAGLANLKREAEKP